MSVSPLCSFGNVVTHALLELFDFTHAFLPKSV
jgi:hypothetical protein